MTVHFQDYSASETVTAKALPVAKQGDLPAETSQQSGLYRRGFKRVLDVALVLLALPVVLPIVLLMMLLVARDGAAPLYTQERIGRGGRIFRILKIRTMVPDADATFAAYLEKNPQARQEWDSTQKLKCDPRITRIGGLLRKTSLDELPQLWNVLTGDMSIVGPRPMMVSQRSLYPGTAYYTLRPGITGSWQVSDRNEGSFAGRAVYDTKYAADLSMVTDLSILLRTVSVVMRRTGY